MKHKIKCLLSLLLSLTMLTAALPAPVWAEETGFAQATGAEAAYQVGIKHLHIFGCG